MESFVSVKSSVIITICDIFIIKREINKAEGLQGVGQAKRIKRMALISDSVNLSMTDFCYLCEEVDILKDIEV